MLGASYWIVRPTRADFGNVPRALHAEMLACAAVALLLLVGALLYFVATPLAPMQMWALVACVAVYFALQLAFFPVLRAALRGDVSRVAVRALLIAAVLPLVVIATLSLLAAYDSLLVHVVVGACASIPVLHAVVNDAVLYGVLF